MRWRGTVLARGGVAVVAALILGGCALWPLGNTASNQLRMPTGTGLPEPVATGTAVPGLIPLDTDFPQPLPSGAGNSGSDEVVLLVEAVDVGCCFIEGSLHFVQLEGPTSMTWQINPAKAVSLANDSWRYDEPPLPVRPGSYTVTFWQRPCDGNCGYLDPEVTRCSDSFVANSGDQVGIDAHFPIQAQCSVSVWFK